MSFWDTVAGYQFAEVLISELPKLNKKPEQHVLEAKKGKAAETIREEIRKGSRLRFVISNGDACTLVFEK